MLCVTGIELRQNAMTADRHFKDEIIRVFSRTTRTEQERELLEELGLQQRNADEMFRRHRLSCTACNQAITFFDTEERNKQFREIG